MEARRGEVEAAWKGAEDIGTVDFARVTRDFCGFPTLFARPLMARINLHCSRSGDGDLRVSLVDFWHFWSQEMELFDADARFFRLLREPGANFVRRSDFAPFVDALVAQHPGLRFLAAHAEFQEKYSLTVATVSHLPTISLMASSLSTYPFIFYIND